jgi:hypothetical protein
MTWMTSSAPTGERESVEWIDTIFLAGFSESCNAARIRKSSLVVPDSSLVTERVSGNALEVLHTVYAIGILDLRAATGKACQVIARISNQQIAVHQLTVNLSSPEKNRPTNFRVSLEMIMVWVRDDHGMGALVMRFGSYRDAEELLAKGPSS